MRASAQRDAQSLVFDASNLFSVDKFSGYDRVEGGGRANVGSNNRRLAISTAGGSNQVLFGQLPSCSAELVSAVADVTNTRRHSGLAPRRSGL